MTRILIIGGYGNFGTYISKKLATQVNFQVIVAGRNETKAKELATQINAEWAVLDITKNLDEILIHFAPNIVIHTSGPYQGQSYHVAEACIKHGCHYLDLADARGFVSQITQLDAKAKAANISIISGASSVPCLSSAVINKFKPLFKSLNAIDYGIATAQQTNQGLATTSSILTYTGKPFQTLQNGTSKTIYGWQDLHLEKYPSLGKRWLSNCDVPDLSIFPEIYPEIKTIRFFAGAEIPLAHIGLWVLSWLPRLKIIKTLSSFDRFLLFLAKKLDILGTGNSAFHMHMNGKSSEGKPLKKSFYILAFDGDGPLIPCIPAILLTKKLATEKNIPTGAFSSAGLLTLQEYIEGLEGLKIRYIES
ncbi:saccharopine dehydrogenase family protein [Sneathiella glossodoripedis]|uniref:saccharopine dehydrogenase family protein n=1 Tax=Sneathiella glossodoripedis TaxID=418853 RepID=UPI000470E726|nr:saccharopine dehydrogenase NADP-binding domain-containing protein [Sneathiella glossodoripedis]